MTNLPLWQIFLVASSYVISHVTLFCSRLNRLSLQKNSQQEGNTSDGGAEPFSSDGNNTGVEPFSSSSLQDGWLRKTNFRKSGNQAGKKYYTFIAPDGKTCNSLKSAIRHDNQLRQSTTTAPIPATHTHVNGGTNKSTELDCAVDGVTSLAVNSLESFDHESIPPLYFDAIPCKNDVVDNASFDIFADAENLQPWTISGTAHHRRPTGDRLDPANTASLAIVLYHFAMVDGNRIFNSELEVREYLDRVNQIISEKKPTGYFETTVKDVLAEFANELSFYPNREHHCIDWYYKLFDAISKLLGLSISVILPPDGRNEKFKSRIVTFRSNGMVYGGLSSRKNTKPHVVLRLLIDRTKIEPSLLEDEDSDGGPIVAGVAVFVRKDDLESSDSDSVTLGSEDSSVSEHSHSSASNKSNEEHEQGKRAKSQPDDTTEFQDSKMPATAMATVDNTPSSSPVDEDGSSVARNLFTTPKSKKSPALLSSAESDEIIRLKEQLRQLQQQRVATTGIASTNSTSSEKVVKGEFKESVREDSILVGVATKCGTTGGGNDGGVGGDDGWGAFGSGGTASILKASPPMKSQVTSAVTVEVSKPITNRKTGHLSVIIMWTNFGQPFWWGKHHYLSHVAQTYYQHVLKSKDVPRCFDFRETVIKNVIFGNNNIARKQRKGGSNYPIMKIYSIMDYPSNGFPLETHISKFESTIKNMFADSKVPAILAVHTMKETSANMYNGFLSGSYRVKKNRGVAYKNEEELTADIKVDLEGTFKNGLGSKSFDHPLNRYMTDWFIKSYLTELGYSSFEDVIETEKHNIYRNGQFPVWDEIEEDQMNE